METYKNSSCDILEYSRIYYEQDCEVLKQGYNILRNWILDEVNFDIDNT